MRKVIPGWKVLAVTLSLFLTVLIWARGLQESFDRPSVAPKLSMHQQEMALLAKAAIPQPLSTLFVGESPEQTFLETLKEIPDEQINEREKLMLAGLEPSLEKRKLVLQKPFKDKSLLVIQKAFLDISNKSIFSSDSLIVLDEIKGDPLLYQTACLAIGGSKDMCISLDIARTMALRLMISQGLPIVGLIVGICLLIRQVWLLVKTKSKPWPSISPLPLSLLDMALLIAGGFVVLGEVTFPMLVAPISNSLIDNFKSPTSDALKVLVGYSAMALPPLYILNRQLKDLGNTNRPSNGWLQWKIRPVGNGFLKALNGLLMVMPLVLLITWIIRLFVGDPGGSNPLLDLVLSSKDPLALMLFALTTIILAPLFEEVIFRGTLLPVLSNELGVGWGVFGSALVFALAHLSVGEFPPLLVLGLGLAFVRLSSGRLFPCFLMHSLWNGVTFMSLVLIGG